MINSECDSDFAWTLNGTSSIAAGGMSGTAIRIIGEAKNLNSATQTIKINRPANETYVLSGWAKADSVRLKPIAGGSRRFELMVKVLYTDTEIEPEYHNYPFNEQTTEWQYLSVPVVPKQPDKTVKSITVYCIYGRNCNTAYFDRISLTSANVSCYTYDNKGNLCATKDFAHGTVGTEYEANGIDPKKTTYADGSSDTFTHLSNHTVSSVKNDYGVQTGYLYDAYGNLTRTRICALDANNNEIGPSITTSSAYSSDGNYLATATDALGNTTTYSYNEAVGLLNYVIDANNNRISYLYDRYHSLSALFADTNGDGVFDAAEQGVRYVYDAGVLTQIQTASTTYILTYDAHGAMSSVRVGTETLVSYDYDYPSGRLKTVYMANGSTFSYQYDQFSRLTSVLSDDDTPLYDITYDTQGNVYSYYEHNNHTEYRYEYDPLGRILRSFIYKNGELKQTFAIQYDSVGRKVGYTSDIAGLETRQESCSYNTEGDSAPTGSLKDYHNGNGGSSSVNYDALGRVSGETYHNASGSTYNRQIGYVTNGTSTSNLPNRLTYTASTGENWSDIQYTYDSVGNITEINDGTRRYVYVYDALGQLTSETIYRGTQVTPEYFYTYTYDRAGNLVTGGGFENFLASDYSFSYTYGNAQWGDQLTALNGQAVTYDKSGNPLSYRGKTLTWTDNQHLQRYYYDSTLWFQYTYNRNGIRTGKNFYNMVKYDYVVDGDKVIAQTWLSNTMLFYYDQNGAPQSVRYNGTLYNYVLNLQGDVIQIRDTDGNLVVQYLYNAWGKVLKVVDADGNTVTSGVGYENPLRYRGYYYDWESGFYYLNSRYYDPEVGRFISPDDLNVLTANSMGLTDKNLYAYCDNNPIMRVDYGGEFWGELFAAVAIVTGVVAVGALVVVTAGVAAPGLAVAGAGILGGGGLTTGAIATATTTVYVSSTISAASAVVAGGITYKEHTKNKRQSTKGKHEKGQARKGRDKGGEKGDIRRKNPWGRQKQ